jgi:predicted HTH transcriptional regulator
MATEVPTGEHPSVQRNPIIADIFHRAGLIEKWGRGTNRVAEMCRASGGAAPTFREIGGAALVTFSVKVGDTAPILTGEATPQVVAILEEARTPRTREELQRAAKLSDREHFRVAFLQVLLAVGWLERTIPAKPHSRLQRYRTTEAGRNALARTPS